MFLRLALFLLAFYSSAAVANDFKLMLWCETVSPDSSFYDGLNNSLAELSESIIEQKERLDRDISPEPTYEYAERLLNETMRREGISDFYYDWELEQQKLSLLNLYLYAHLDSSVSMREFNSFVPQLVNWFNADVKRCRRVAQERSRVRESERQGRNALFAAAIVGNVALSILRDVGSSEAVFSGNCNQINDASARAACNGDAYQTESNDARNIILGNCFSLSQRANDSGLREVCSSGKRGCYSLKDNSSVSACVSCDGSNKWARLFAVDYEMSCY